MSRHDDVPARFMTGAQAQEHKLQPLAEAASDPHNARATQQSERNAEADDATADDTKASHARAKDTDALQRAWLALDEQQRLLDAAVAAADALLIHDLAPAARDLARSLQIGLHALQTRAATTATEVHQPTRTTRDKRLTATHLGHIVDDAVTHAAHLACLRGVSIDLFVDPALPTTVLVDEADFRRTMNDLLGAFLGCTPSGVIVLRACLDASRAVTQAQTTVPVRIAVAVETRPLPPALAPAVPSVFALPARSACALGASLRVDAQSDGQPCATLDLNLPVSNAAPLVSRVASRRLALIGKDDGLRARLADTLAALAMDVTIFASVAEVSERDDTTFDAIFVMRAAALGASAEELAALDRTVRIPERDVFVVGASAAGSHGAQAAATINVANAGAHLWTGTRRTLSQPLTLDRVVAAIRGDPFGRQTEAPASILVIDDDPELRTVVRRFLHDGGHRVIEAENSADGIHLALSHPRPDLVLMDLDLPGLDGFGAMEALRTMERHRQLCHVPVVAVTAHTFPDIVNRIGESGMRGVVQKPVRRAQLMDAVVRHADHRPPMVLLEEDEGQREHLSAALTANSALRVVAAADVEEALRCIQDRRVRRVAVAVHRHTGGRDSARLALSVPARLAGVRNPPPRAVALLDGPDDWLRTAALAAGFSDALPISDLLALVVALNSDASLLPQAAHDEDEPRAFVDDDVVDLIVPFLRRQQAELERAHQALENAAFDDIRRIGHRLRGTAGSFGLDELAELGARLEQAASDRDGGACRATAVEARRLVATVRILPRSTMRR